MAALNWLGLGVLTVAILVCVVLKSYTHRKLKDMDGFDGVIQGKPRNVAGRF